MKRKVLMDSEQKPELTIGIVENEERDQNVLASFLKRYFKEKNLTPVLSFFSSAEEYLEKERTFQVLFLDIELGEMDGLSLAEAIRKKDQKTILIFVTNMSHLASRGYRVNAFDFVVKPLIYDDFVLMMDRLMKSWKGNKANYSLSVHTKDGEVLFSLKDLHYVEVQGHFLYFHLDHKVVKSRNTLKTIENVIEEAGFLRCHRSFFVNPADIDYVEGMEVVVKGERVPISHLQKKEFLDAFNRYLSGEDSYGA